MYDYVRSLSIVDYVFFFFHLNCRIKSWTIQLVLLLDLLVLVLLHLGLVFWILIWVLVFQLWPAKNNFIRRNFFVN
jgi:hypothetical protein